MLRRKKSWIVEVVLFIKNDVKQRLEPDSECDVAVQFSSKFFAKLSNLKSLC